jgi:hypothetical protein
MPNTRLLRQISAICFCVSIASCSIIPDIPDDSNLPVQQILQYTACELRSAFIELNSTKYSGFNAASWQVAVTLTPKVDRELTAGLGLTGKSTSNSKILTFTNFAVSGPGLQYDTKGTRNATAVYNFTSKNLIDTKKYPLKCDSNSSAYNELAKNLGVKEWLIRAVAAKDGAVGLLATFDKPTYSSEIFIKYSGNGTFTYNVPLGTDFASLAGSYDTDETLAIALTSVPKSTVIVAQTLPIGGQFGNGPPTTIVIPSRIEGPTKLDSLETEQNIINSINGLQRSLPQ